MDTDRNLLFGVLAMQLEYIDATRFAESCGSLAASNQTTLRDVLVDGGWMKLEEAQEVDRLLARKLQKHDGDVEQALASASPDEAQRALRNVRNKSAPDVNAEHGRSERGAEGSSQRDGRSAAEWEAPTGSYATSPRDYVPAETVNYEPQELRSRYTLTKMHGEGGIGRVWLAYDQHLNRQVALKEIRPDKEQSELAWSRFVKEAQITSQLEHPNIVSVYELARGEQERHSFYTMRFVRGATLRRAIDHYHRQRREGLATATRLHELLHSFVLICQAVGYAHSRGVVHRDLKPSNIMLGAFGEVVVLDWGLAKMLDHEDDDDPLAAHPISVTNDADQLATQYGAVLGTLPYSAPEQAAGRIDQIDFRTDVYGLGAILYALLTGNQPHHGTSTEELCAQILNHPTPRVRAKAVHVSPALDAICAKAMARKRGERYQTPRELADDVQRWLADEPVSVYRDPLVSRVGRWLRRHRTWARSLAVSLLIVTAVSVAAIFFVERARRAEARAKDEATRRFQDAREAVDAMLTGVGDQLAAFPGMNPLRERLLAQAAERYREYAAEHSDDPALQIEAARALLRLGDVYSSLQGRRGETSRDAAEDAFQDGATRLKKLLAVPEIAGEARIELAIADTKLGTFYRDAGRHAEAAQRYDAAISRLDALPAEVRKLGRPRNQRAGILVNQAILLGRQGDLNGAIDLLREAIRISKELVAAHDDVLFRNGLALARANLGNMLSKLGNHVAAAEELEHAVAHYAQLAEQHQDEHGYLEKLAATRLSLAVAYRKLGQDARERTTYEMALGDYDLLVTDRPDVPAYRAERALASIDYALFLNALGENPQAEELVSFAFTEIQDLLSSRVAPLAYHEYWALAKATLGRVRADRGEFKEAVAALDEAINDYEVIIEQFPEAATSAKPQLAASRSVLGIAAWRNGDLPEAEAALRAAIHAWEDLRQDAPNNLAYKNSLAWSHTHLAELLWEQGRQGEATARYEAAIALRETIERQPGYAYNFAKLLIDCRDPSLADPARALEFALHACEQSGQNARFQTVLGAAYYRDGQLDKAIETLQKVGELSPQGGSAHEFWRALALCKRGQDGDVTAARDQLQAAKERMDESAPGRHDLIRLRQDAEKAVAAAASEQVE